MTSGEAAGSSSTDGAKSREASLLVLGREAPERQLYPGEEDGGQQHRVPSRQVIEGRWPSETDDHACGGGGGGAGAGVSKELDDLPEVSESARKKWSLRSTRPTPNSAISAAGIEAGGVARGTPGGVSVAGWGVGLMPPRWVPDEQNTSCVGCGKDFDWARRRHHCRACGRLYCYACSRFRALLPRSFGTRDPQRLCQPCNARVAPLQEMLAESVSNAVKDNGVEQGGMASYLNRPIVFTLGAEVRKAAYTIHNFTKEGMIQDASIPQELLGRAKGLAFLTVIKGGFIVAGRVGTGLVVARTEEGFWSAPSAIATLGMGWGALIGGEITDFVLVLNTDSAVEAFSGRGQVSIGAELGVAVGPLGRTGAGNVSVAAEGVAHAYSYSHSRGLFAGLSLEGGVIVARPDVNRKFYGREVSARELLSGSVAPPPAARPLYEALEHRGSAADQHRGNGGGGGGGGGMVVGWLYCWRFFCSWKVCMRHVANVGR
eukprot:jgi/Undpi1/973/HiC_scaffold_10.g04437.m1